MEQVFPLLKMYWPHLHLAANATVVVPLCGMSLDIQWLIKQGHYIIGVDVSPKAIRSLMQTHAQPFEKSSKGQFDRYKSTSLELWCGDFFKLQKEWLPPVDAIYDKAALIALPPALRKKYARTIQNLTEPHTQIFLNCFEYEQNEMSGPPFAVFRDELEASYGEQFSINLLHSHSLLEELTTFHQRGLRSYLIEKIYHLSPAE